MGAAAILSLGTAWRRSPDDPFMVKSKTTLRLPSQPPGQNAGASSAPSD